MLLRCSALERARTDNGTRGRPDGPNAMKKKPISCLPCQAQGIRTTFFSWNERINSSGTVHTCLEMFVINFPSSICLIISIQQALSTPFVFDSADDEFYSDFSPYVSEPLTETTWDDPNTIALFPNDDYVDIASNLDLLGDSFFHAPEWTPFLPNEESFWTSDDMIVSDESASCPLGKKRDGASCAAPDEELHLLQLPNLFQHFEDIERNNPSTGDKTQSDANAVKIGVEAGNPCKRGGIHACCDGPLSQPIRNAVLWIDNCALGTQFFFFFLMRCTHTLSLILNCFRTLGR